MELKLKYKGKKYNKIKISIASDAKFNEILDHLNSILILGSRSINIEHVIYAVLELINNSLRAHREKKIDKPIDLIFETKNQELQIIVQDWGGGFNPSKLPYDINKEPEKIDLNSDKFNAYREANEYLRFGMGLYLAKKTFDFFSLSFVDNNNNEINWEDGKAAGTCVNLKLGDKNE